MIRDVFMLAVFAMTSGGRTVDPTYEEVSAGTTGHAEAIQIVFAPQTISYQALLEVFRHNIDPTVKNQQFCDHGTQYRTAIFYHDEEQKRLNQLWGGNRSVGESK